MPAPDWLPYHPALYINIEFGLSRIKLYSDVDIEMEIESGIATHNLVRSWHGCQPLVRDTFLDEEYVRIFEIKITSLFISR